MYKVVYVASFAAKESSICRKLPAMILMDNKAIRSISSESHDEVNLWLRFVHLDNLFVGTCHSSTILVCDLMCLNISPFADNICKWKSKAISSGLAKIKYLLDSGIKSQKENIRVVSALGIKQNGGVLMVEL